MHVASGIYGTAAYVRQNNDVVGLGDTTLLYVQGGITKNWFGPGATTFYGEWSQVDHGLLSSTSGSKYLPFSNSRANIWGLGVVQAIDAAAMEVYLSYRRFTGDLENIPGSGTLDLAVKDVDLVMGGARVKF